VGATKEDLTADADRLVALFAARQQSGGAGGGPRTPAPDPSQGARGSNAAADLDARIAQAQKDNNWREVMRLQNSKLDAAKTT
jgi:hypothetical protein